MDPTTYCDHAMEELQGASGQRFAGLSRPQLVVVLTHFGPQELSPREFVGALKLLTQSSQRLGRTGLATAARAVLDDWQTRCSSP